MTAKADDPTLPRVTPYNTFNFQRRLVLALEVEKEATQPKTLHEIAVELHHQVLENYFYIVINSKNPAHIWSCLSDLAAVASAYHLLDGIDHPTTFIEVLPEWLMNYLGECAERVHALIINHQIDEQGTSIQDANKSSAERTEIKETAHNPKNGQALKFQRPNYTSRFIAEKIPKAFDLIHKGRNRLSIAASERQIFAETLNAKVAGLSRIEAAAVRKSKRRPDLMRDPTDEKQGDERSELQRDLSTVGMGYRVWERRSPSKRRR